MDVVSKFEVDKFFFKKFLQNDNVLCILDKNLYNTLKFVHFLDSLWEQEHTKITTSNLIWPAALRFMSGLLL